MTATTAASHDTPAPDGAAPWRTAARRSVRRWAVGSLAGAVVGLLVGGVGGRLFMALLASLNREDHGVITSDGFPMGEVTLSGTANLLLVGTVLGVLGAGLFLLLRDLRVGPGWFGHACIVVGGTVTVGAVMLHADGPDFTLLEPTWAAIALTLAVPLAYTLVMPPLVDRWTRDDSALMTSSSRWVHVGLVPWVFPLTFLVPVAAAGWVTRRSLHAAGSRPARVARTAAPWVGRALLTALFVVALVALVRDVAGIYEVVGSGRFL